MKAIYESIFGNVLLPAYERLSGRGGLSRHIQEYDQAQWLPPQALHAKALKKLNALLDHSWRTVPYLKERWTNAGLQNVPLQTTAELSAYPILTKAEITANFDRMISREWRNRAQYKITGGSSGEPFRFAFDPESDARRNAVMWRGYRWAGAELGRKAVYLWSSPSKAHPAARLKEALYHKAFNRVYLDSFVMSAAVLPEYARRLSQAKPKVLIGYVSALVALGKWALKENVELYRPNAVISGAERLTAPDRAVLQEAFGAPVFNSYGCREVMLIGMECDEHDGLHISADHLVVETVSAISSRSDQDLGQIVLTDLHNFAMPLVRYANGDMASTSRRQCRCGRGLPLLDRVEGRVLDMIRTASGKMLPGEFFPHVLKDFDFVKEFQVIQRSLDTLDISIVPTRNVSESEMHRVRTLVSNAVGAETGINIQTVEMIQRNSSGKLRVTISELGSAEQ